jgi:hypothetical protein
MNGMFRKGVQNISRAELHAFSSCEVMPCEAAVQGHVHKIVGPWFQEHTDIRDVFNKAGNKFSVPFCQDMVGKLEAAAQAVGRDHPVPKISERKRARLAREEAISGAKREQEREERLLAALDKKRTAAGVVTSCLTRLHRQSVELLVLSAPACCSVLDTSIACILTSHCGLVLLSAVAASLKIRRSNCRHGG